MVWKVGFERLYTGEAGPGCRGMMDERERETGLKIDGHETHEELGPVTGGSK